MTLYINQCQKYKDWGMDLKWYCKTIDVQTGKLKIKHYQPPSLEEQLAFAFKSCQDKCCKRDRHYAYIEIKRQYREIKGKWEIVTVVEGAWRWPTKEGNCMYGFITDKFIDPDSQQAMFKLQEYISEVSDE